MSAEIQCLFLSLINDIELAAKNWIFSDLTISVEIGGYLKRKPSAGQASSSNPSR